MICKIAKLFQDPQIQTPIITEDFTHYINDWKKIIASTRQMPTPKIIEANAPFEIRPKHPTKIGVLLIHGLLDSCFIMKEIAEHLSSTNLLIRAVLLPGHGTIPGALLNIHYEDWLQTVNQGMTSLAKEVDKIFLIGFSTGAIAAIHEALKNNFPLAGIIAFAPAFRIKSPLAVLAKWLPYLGKAWISLNEEIDYVKYSSLPSQAVSQVYELGKKVRNALQTQSLNCPLLMIVSGNDEIISSPACLDYFYRDSHPKSEMIYYVNSDMHLNDDRITVRCSSYPEQHILNFSHIGLTVSANNMHYGSGGDYPLASHINREKHVDFGAFNTLEIKIYQKLYQWKLSQHFHQRLTFNPDFAFAMKKIHQFIDKQSK